MIAEQVAYATLDGIDPLVGSDGEAAPGVVGDKFARRWREHEAPRALRRSPTSSESIEIGFNAKHSFVALPILASLNTSSKPVRRCRSA